MLNIWSIFPGADQELHAKLSALYAHMVNAGPADDAERAGLPVQVFGNTAVVSIVGPMLRRAGWLAELFGFTGTDRIRGAIVSALADSEIERVVLRIDSPGGEVSGIAELSDTIANASKPVIAVTEGTAASAAYYVASQADKIYVGRSDMVGSIGVRIGLYDYSKAFAAQGIEAVPIDTGEFKSAGMPGTEITEAQRAHFQEIVDFHFDAFINAVAAGRKISKKAARAAADGRMFNPAEAMDLGLIDGIGTLADVLNEQKPKRKTQSARARLQI